MCSIFGVSACPHTSTLTTLAVDDLIRLAKRRGRDGLGWQAQMGKNADIISRTITGEDIKAPKNIGDISVLIGNARAEPTTEHVKNKRIVDQQPYSLGPLSGGWNVVHNGTIANDKELRTNQYPSRIDSAAIVERLVEVERTEVHLTHLEVFKQVVRELKGSFAILAYRDNDPNLYTAANYRPIWTLTGGNAVMFSSSRDGFNYNKCDGEQPVMLPPYTINVFRTGTHIYQFPLNNAGVPLDLVGANFLVVCSGGLDSTVAAKWACEYGDKVELAHFLYGSRAEGPESDQVIEIANAMEGCEGVKFFNMRSLYDPEDSPLLQADSEIAGGEAGAEFAHEWVPARNLVMLSVATAYAEAKGYDFIVLGNNLEEAGAYPDNEPEFIDRFNDILPFAVGDGKRVRVLMPVGNLMKHEIVAMGHDLGAPMHLTWSCYRAGAKHCGTCGPCYMRRKAFEMNDLPEVIEYEN